MIVNGQNFNNRSLDYFLKKASHDTSGLNFLLDASKYISFTDPDSGIILAKTALQLARNLHYKKGEAQAMNDYGEAYHFLGEYPQALTMQLDALRMYREMKDSANEAETLGLIGIVYNELGQYRQAIQYLTMSIGIYQQMHSKYKGSFELANIGDAYSFLNIPDSAVYYQRKAYHAFNEYPTGIHLKPFILVRMGNTYAQIGEKDSALKFYNESASASLVLNDKLNMSQALNKMAEVYESAHQFDSALHYAKMAFDNASSLRSKLHEMRASNLLARLFKKTMNLDSAFYYLNIAATIRDSLYGPEKLRQLQLLMLEEQQKQETILRQHEQFRNKIRYTALVSGLAIFSLLTFLLLRNIQHKKRSNALLQNEKQKVEKALEELKSTQAQLIQSEKMASLGELTAGIAHEIQNPLNFVNNFSEVNKELIQELKEERNKEQGTRNEDRETEILNDIEANEGKINSHGKRADAIVKGMLQHSRTSSGQKERTDINGLADEYLRLAYQGFRVKDKSFNVTLGTEFDPRVGNVDIISQEIGRVILNVINNAFYAVNEKAKQSIPGYEPTVTVSTRRVNDKVELHVSDNGNGIPSSIKDKIFQPFFTTKPTGKGTGLGLSLAYDIVKAHGGEIKLETKEHEGSEFIIQLPIQ